MKPIRYAALWCVALTVFVLMAFAPQAKPDDCTWSPDYPIVHDADPFAGGQIEFYAVARLGTGGGGAKNIYFRAKVFAPDGSYYDTYDVDSFWYQQTVGGFDYYACHGYAPQGGFSLPYDGNWSIVVTVYYTVGTTNYNRSTTLICLDV